MAKEDFPQKFIRVAIPVYMEWTDEGPGGDLVVREDFARAEGWSDEELIDEAIDILVGEPMSDHITTEYARAHATISRGEYLENGMVRYTWRLSKPAEEVTKDARGR